MSICTVSVAQKIKSHNVFFARAFWYAIRFLPFSRIAFTPFLRSRLSARFQYLRMLKKPKIFFVHAFGAHAARSHFFKGGAFKNKAIVSPCVSISICFLGVVQRSEWILVSFCTISISQTAKKTQKLLRSRLQRSRGTFRDARKDSAFVIPYD